MRFKLYSGMKKATLALVVSLMLVACSSQPTFNIDHDDHTNFASYKTYRWYDDVYDSKEADYRQYNASDERVRTHIDGELGKKRLEQITSGQADFWVNYHISKQDRMKIDNFSGYPSSGMHGGVGVGTYGTAVSVGYSSGPSVKEYSEGTVVLDIIDARTSKIVWRGIAEGRLKKDLSHNEKDHRAAEVSRELLADFPPSPPVTN
ncbi:MAG: hypothetical protein ACI9JM_001817 [Halioglobus sp.]|jgi:hypothetical protein